MHLSDIAFPGLIVQEHHSLTVRNTKSSYNFQPLLSVSPASDVGIQVRVVEDVLYHLLCKVSLEVSDTNWASYNSIQFSSIPNYPS